MAIIAVEGQHCCIEFNFETYVKLLHRFRDHEELIATLNFISDTGFRKSYYGNGIYVLKLSGNESISTNRILNINYTSYRGGVRAVGMSIRGRHPLLTLQIIEVYDENIRSEKEDYNRSLGRLINPDPFAIYSGFTFGRPCNISLIYEPNPLPNPHVLFHLQ
ncbi:hypothetical protein RCL_jg25598.t1 [Rhizophagus clarus]|uniref:Uncharacterized protein n=1 Tax=Rhizophagus clarus TaxID=94130 RepID=A0A8H3LLK8_9GLOM|nr:hypothetical protein RCL_jg25598.t1 [Rhizophagus clarus]